LQCSLKQAKLPQPSSSQDSILKGSFWVFCFCLFLNRSFPRTSKQRPHVSETEYHNLTSRYHHLSINLILHARTNLLLSPKQENSGSEEKHIAADTSVFCTLLD